MSEYFSLLVVEEHLHVRTMTEDHGCVVIDARHCDEKLGFFLGCSVLRDLDVGVSDFCIDCFQDL